MGSAIRITLITPLLGLLAAVGIIAMSASPAFAWEIVAQCDDSGQVVGEIDVPQAGTFDIFVTDHRPGEGFWVEIPGSRQTITVVAGKEGLVSYGPLDISNVRSGVNSIRVEQTATNEKSASFPPCPKPTPTNTPTATPTSIVTSTPTATPTRTATKTPVPPTKTRTNTPVPPTATRTVFSTLVPPATYTPPAVCRTICLPDTGTGGYANQGEQFSTGKIIFIAVTGALALMIIAVVIGGLVYLQIKHPAT